MKYVASLFLLGSMTSVSGVLVRQDGGGDKSVAASKTMHTLIAFLQKLLDESAQKLDVMVQANIDDMGDRKKTLADKNENLQLDTITLAETRDALSENTLQRKATTATLKDEKEAKDAAKTAYTNENKQDTKTKTNLQTQKTTADKTIAGLNTMLTVLKQVGQGRNLDKSRQLVTNLISARQQKVGELTQQIGDVDRDITEDTNNFNTADDLARQSINKLTGEETTLKGEVKRLAGKEKTDRQTVATDKSDIKTHKQDTHEANVEDQDNENNLKNLIATLKSLIHDFTSTLDATSFIQTAMAKRDPQAAKLELQSFASKYHNSEISKISADLQDDECPWPIVNKALVQAQTTLNDDIQQTQKDKDAFSQRAQQLAMKSQKTCEERDTANSQAVAAKAAANTAESNMKDKQRELATAESVYSKATKAHNDKNRQLNDELTESTESFQTVQFGIKTVRERAGSGYGGNDVGTTDGTGATGNDATSTEKSGTKKILDELNKVSDDLKLRMNSLKSHIEKDNQEQTKRTNTFKIQKKQLETNINNFRSEMESETQKYKTNSDKEAANEMLLVNLNQETFVLFDQKKSTTQKDKSKKQQGSPCTGSGSKTCGNLFKLAGEDATCETDSSQIDTNRDGQVENMERAMKEKQDELKLLKQLTTELKAQLQC